MKVQLYRRVLKKFEQEDYNLQALCKIGLSFVSTLMYVTSLERPTFLKNVI